MGIVVKLCVLDVVSVALSVQCTKGQNTCCFKILWPEPVLGLVTLNMRVPWLTSDHPVLFLFAVLPGWTVLIK